MTSITAVSSFRSSPLAPLLDEQTISDDECMSRLERAIAEHDEHQLGEVALLIGRLAVAIE